jgi:hypothetical protein
MARQGNFGLFGIGLLFMVAQQPTAHALTADEVVVKKVIADTMTPEELAAYKVRLAANFSHLPPPSSVLPQTPSDTCAAATREIDPTLPFGPVADTTVGATNNFDLPHDETDPTCTAATTCTGGGLPASLPRGAIYTGTGTAPDRAWRIRTNANCNLTITMDPTSTHDLALIVYQPTCSSSLADCACVDDTGGDGTAESVTLSAVAGTEYFIVVDGYSSVGPPGPSGPYTLGIAGAGCALVPVELQQFSVE